MLAALEGKTEVVVELMKAGANVDLQNNVCQYYMYGAYSIYTTACSTLLVYSEYHLVYHTTHVHHHTGGGLCPDVGCHGWKD